MTNYPYTSMIFGIIMMAFLTAMVTQFTSTPQDTCQGNSNGFQKCIQLLNDMKQLMIFAWPIYIGGIVVFSLYIKKFSKKVDSK